MSSLSNIPQEEAVLVHFDDWKGNLEDLETLEDSLSEIIESRSLGEFDGNELGPNEATLFMYGPDAERLFKGIETTLRNSLLSSRSRVVIRYGPPGSKEKIIQL